jgi:hypothetical protein
MFVGFLMQKVLSGMIAINGVCGSFDGFVIADV